MEGVLCIEFDFYNTDSFVCSSVVHDFKQKSSRTLWLISTKFHLKHLCGNGMATNVEQIILESRLVRIKVVTSTAAVLVGPRENYIIQSQA